MDTASYLHKQGWRGDGHALHHSGRGITKPISISQKQNVLGIGKKKHDAHADQWWARAFDATLKGLNTTKDEATGKTQGVSLRAGAQALQMVGRGGSRWVGQGGLYGGFVRGKGLGGTLEPEGEGEVVKDNKEEAKRDVEDVGAVQEVLKASKKRFKREHGFKKPAEQSPGTVEEPKEVQDLTNTDIEKGPNQESEKALKRREKEERRQRRQERRAKKETTTKDVEKEITPIETPTPLKKRMKSSEKEKRRATEDG